MYNSFDILTYPLFKKWILYCEFCIVPNNSFKTVWRILWGAEGAAAPLKIYGKFNIQGRILFMPLYEKLSAAALPPKKIKILVTPLF